MNNRGTTALIALFFAGLIGLWVADLVQVPTAAERDRNKGRILVDLINVKPDDVQKIEIIRGTEPLVFERREGNSWQMTAPIDVAADPSMVENLAFKLKELARKPQADTLKGDPAEFGLATPAHRVTLWGRSIDAPIAALDLGKVSLDRRYVRAGSKGAGIEVVPALGLEVVELPAVRWRDREVFRVPSFEVNDVRISLPAPGGAATRTLELARGADSWRIVQPFRALATESKIEALVADLGSLRITRDSQFITNDASKADLDRFGLTQPSLTITVAASRGNARRPDQVLRVGKPVEDQPERVYAQVGDQNDVIAIDSRVLTGLSRVEPNQFRSDKVADINPNWVTRFAIEDAAGSYTVERTGNQWRIGGSLRGLADPKAVAEFFKMLEGLRSGPYLSATPADLERSGLTKPAETLRFWQTSKNPGQAWLERKAQEDPPSFTLNLGTRDAGKKVVYAQVGGDNSILALPDSAATLFRQSWSFRDRQILAVATDQIERIRFEGTNKQVTIQAPPVKLNLSRNAPTGWWMSEPVTSLVDDASVGKLLKLLAAFRVDGFAADTTRDLKPFGLDVPSLRVTWSIPDLGKTPASVPLRPSSDSTAREFKFADQTLLVGGPVPDQGSMRYAMLVGQPLVFLLGRETLAVLDAEWHNHQITKFDPTQVDEIRLDWPGTDLSFSMKRDPGKGWSFAGPIVAAGIDPKTAPELVLAASDLTTTRYGQYSGEIPAGVGLTPPRLVIQLGGPGLKEPIELAIGAAADPARSYASASSELPGAVFLINNAPFFSWLKVQPPTKDELPAEVFLREPEPTPAPNTPTGQSGAQPR